MRKIYTLAALAAIATMPALAVNVATLKNATPLQGNAEMNVRTFTAKERPAKAKASESYNWVLLGEGKYAASIVADTYGCSANPADVSVYEAEGHAGLYKVVGVWADIVPDAELIVDATDPEFVMIPIQDTGIVDNVDGVTYIASATYLYTEVMGYTKEEIIANAPGEVIVNADGMINLPVGTLALQWPEAPADSQYQTDPTAWYGGRSDGYLVLPGATYEDPWIDLGKATFDEHIISEVFGKTVEPYEVTLRQNRADRDLYQVIDPWSALYTALKFNGTSPTMELDATDPSNIIVGQTSTGISGQTDGLYYLLSMSYYYEAIGEGADATEEALRITLEETEETDASGTVYDVSTFTFPVESMALLASNAGTFYTAATQESTIVLKTARDSSGVANLTTDAGAPAEYYNLQGIRIANPENGQLVIKREGGKSSVVRMTR